jgi:hypothetical protein
LLGLDPAGIAEVVQIARFGPDALNLVFRVDGRVGERLVYRGEENSFEFVETGLPSRLCRINRTQRRQGWRLSRFDKAAGDVPRCLRRPWAFLLHPVTLIRWLALRTPASSTPQSIVIGGGPAHRHL